MLRIALLTSNLRATPEAYLDEDEQATINAAAIDIYLSCTFIVASDPKRYGRLVEELETPQRQNEFLQLPTGNDDESGLPRQVHELD